MGAAPQHGDAVRALGTVHCGITGMECWKLIRRRLMDEEPDCISVPCASLDIPVTIASRFVIAN